MIESHLSKNIVSVLIVDDHLLIREAYKKILCEIDFIGKFQLAESGEKAIEILKNEPFDIVIMDNSMPKGMTGVETTLWITQNLPSVKVIGISNFDIGSTGIEFFVNGAKVFFEKGLAHEYLENSILTVYNGGIYFSEEHWKDIKNWGLGLDQNNRVELDEREYKIIQHLCEAKSNKFIADALGIKVRRIEQLINEIKVKTGCKTPFQLAMFLTRYKYLK